MRICGSRTGCLVQPPGHRRLGLPRRARCGAAGLDQAHPGQRRRGGGYPVDQGPVFVPLRRGAFRLPGLRGGARAHLRGRGDVVAAALRAALGELRARFRRHQLRLRFRRRATHARGLASSTKSPANAFPPPSANSSHEGRHHRGGPRHRGRLSYKVSLGTGKPPLHLFLDYAYEARDARTSDEFAATS